MHQRRFRTISFINLKVLSARIFKLEGGPLDKESMSSETPTKTEGEVVVVVDKFGVMLGGDPKLVHWTKLIFSLALLNHIAPPRLFIHQTSDSKCERLHRTDKILDGLAISHHKIMDKILD